MRAKIEQSKKALTKPISLYPHQAKFALRRSLDLGMSLSRYMQELIMHDKENNVMASVLMDQAREAGK